MTIHVDGRLFYLTKDVVENLGISRQTLWRWRNEGKIPPGNRYRGNKIIFSEEEVNQIREYTEYIEPIEQINTPQLKLFDKAMGG